MTDADGSDRAKLDGPCGEKIELHFDVNRLTIWPFSCPREIDISTRALG